jgi:hypothetical protein
MQLVQDHVQWQAIISVSAIIVFVLMFCHLLTYKYTTYNTKPSMAGLAESHLLRYTGSLAREELHNFLT